MNLTVCLFLLYLSVNAQSNEPFTNSYNAEYLTLISNNTLELSSDIGLSDEVVYLENLKSTLDLLLLENVQNLDEYENNLDHQIKYLESKSDSDPNKLFLLAELNLKYALALFKYSHELEAAWHFRQAHKNIQRNIKLFPHFKANYKTSGAINIILGSIPEKHQWLLSLIGLQGSIDEGNKQLDQLIHSNSNFRYEAIMTKCLLQAYVLNKAALAVETFNQLIDLDGSLIQLQKMVLYLKNSDGEKAIKAFSSTNDTSLSYTHYLAGEAFLQKGNYQKAEKEFSIFLELHKGISNKKDALYKIWLCHFLSGDSGHQIYRSNAQSAIEGYSEADRYASRVLNNDQLPNKAIMKIRLATDGGFYEQAENIIAQQPILTSKKDTVEYNYRLARLYDKKGDKDLSISLYKSVLRYSKDERWYFAANSALMLGYIYIEKRDYENARFHLKMAMNFKHHEYKNSIDAKAEAALNTISDL